MGRIKEISRKSVHTRKRNPVVYLICEGSETAFIPKLQGQFA